MLFFDTPGTKSELFPLEQIRKRAFEMANKWKNFISDMFRLIGLKK